MTMFPFIAFWILLVAGWYLSELDLKTTAIFVGIWLVGRCGIPFLAAHSAWFIILVVLLDAVLIFKVFGGDVRLR